MSKSTITRLFVGSVVAILAGIFIAAVGFSLAFAAGAFVVSGSDVTAVEPTRFTVAAILTIIVGGLGIVGGAIGQFVAWIGAVVNTSRLEDKTWFILLLVLGLLSFGFIAMLVYVLAGPDGTRPAADRRLYSGTAA
jgi:hypothetical protein